MRANEAAGDGSERRIGLAGLGGRGMSLARICQRLPGARLVAVADLIADRVAAAAAELGGVATYTGHREMLRRERLDILLLATLGMHRREPVDDAIAAGVRGVYLEKPMATRVSDCDAMIAACAAAGVKLSVGHQRRWWPQYRVARDALQGGLIGRPTQGYLYWGSGRIGSVGTHRIDALNFVLGDRPAAWVAGRLDSRSRPQPKWPDMLDPGALGFIYYQDDIRIAIDAMADTKQSSETQVYGDKGRLLLLEDAWEIQHWAPRDEPGQFRGYFPPHYQRPFPNPPRPLEPDAHGTIEALTELVEILGTDRQPSSTGEHGRHTLEIITAFHLSSERGMQALPLPLAGSDRERDLNFR